MVDRDPDVVIPMPTGGSPLPGTEQDSLQRAIREPVSLVPWDDGWPARFEAERERLLAAFPGRILDVAHFGSTAVPGMAAKAVIDMLGGVASMDQADALIEPLLDAGYATSAAYNENLEGRRWLMRHAGGRRTHHLHLVVLGGPQWRRRLRFRDALRADAGLARDYAALKADLARRHAADREAYTAAKETFIRGALDSIPSWFIETQRLRFRAWREDDGALASGLWGDARVTRLIDARGQLTAAQARERLANEIATDRDFGVQYWPVFLRDDGTHAGCCGLRPRAAPGRVFELGFQLRSDQWGRGYALEAARAAIAYAFESMKADALFAGHHPDNQPSRHLLEKLGFRHTHDELYPPTGLRHPCYQLEAGA